MKAAMKTVNIHEAKTQLSKLVEEASKGEAFVIAKAGKPVVKVTALNAPTGAQIRRLGFMAGQISVPDDFDRMGQEEIERIFGKMTRLPKTHELYSCFFVYEEGPPNTQHELNGYGDDLLHKYLDAIIVNGRLGLIYSSKDYSSEWNFHAETKKFMQQDPTKFGVNLIVYALTR